MVLQFTDRSLFDTFKVFLDARIERWGFGKYVVTVKYHRVLMKWQLMLATLVAHGDDMRWNPNDNGIDFNT